MSTIEIESTVIKMVIGKTTKDDREESSGGLRTSLGFDVAGHPRSLARLANLLKQGNINLILVVRATNAATDVKVESIDLPHQMEFGENGKPLSSPGQETDKITTIVEAVPEAGAQIKVEKAVPGSTPIRSGEPIVSHAEAKEKLADALMSGSVTCVNCGYVASKQEIDEQGEGLCPGCGKPPCEVVAGPEEPNQEEAEANATFDDIAQKADELRAKETEEARLAAEAAEAQKPRRRSRKKAYVTTTPLIDSLEPKTQTAILEVAEKAADQLEGTIKDEPDSDAGENHNGHHEEKPAFQPVGPWNDKN